MPSRLPLGAVLLALAAGLLPGTPARAQAAGDWQVELVVFTYRAPPASAEQALSPVADGFPLPTSQLPGLARPDGVEAADGLALTRYPLLEPESLRLGALRQRLARSGELRPLLHLGWRQGAPARRAAARPQELPPIDGSEGLYGTVRLYRRQSLHVELDLSLPVEEDGSPARYRLRETRIVRSGELTYFDHPRLGAIIRVSPAAAVDAGN